MKIKHLLLFLVAFGIFALAKLAAADDATAAQAAGAPQSVFLSPAFLTIAAGWVASHMWQPIMAKIPPVAKPLVAGLGTAALTAVGAYACGTPIPAALGYGLASAGIAKATNWAFFKNGGVLGFIQGIGQAFQSPATVAAPALISASGAPAMIGGSPAQQAAAPSAGPMSGSAQVFK